MSKVKFELTHDQKCALARFIEFVNGPTKVFILKGYAGTGKTTMVNEIMKVLKESEDVQQKSFVTRPIRIPLLSMVVFTSTQALTRILVKSLRNANATTELILLGNYCLTSGFQ